MKSQRLEQSTDSSFFQVVNDHSTTIESLKNEIIKNGRLDATLLRNKIKGSEYQFSIEHAAFYIMRQEAELTRQAQLDGRKNLSDGFSRQYRQQVKTIIQNWKKKLMRDLYNPINLSVDDESVVDSHEEESLLRGETANENSRESSNRYADDYDHSEAEPSLHSCDPSESSDEESIAIAIGNSKLEVNTEAIMQEATESSCVIGIGYQAPVQCVLAIKCAHPLRLVFQDSVLYELSFDPAHITCIVGHMPLYSEVALLVRCSNFKNLRTISLLQPHELRS